MEEKSTIHIVNGEVHQGHVDPSDIPSRELPSDKRFGREIAFGIQQTLACFATDFIDPYVGKWYQKRYGNKQHEVTLKHTMGGEVIGDFAALFVYLGSKRFLSRPIDAITAGVKKGLDPLYTRMGKKTLRQWADEAHLSKDDPTYVSKLEAYKEFQAENLVDSTIIATGSTAINVGAQRALGNKQGIQLIFISKIIGAVLTMGAMLGLRTALPSATKTLDDELSDRYFSKVVRYTKKKLGIEEEEKPAWMDVDYLGADMLNSALRALPETFVDSLNRRYHDSQRKPPESLDHFIDEQKTVTEALMRLFVPESKFGQAFSELYYQQLLVANAPINGVIPKPNDLRAYARESTQRLLRQCRNDAQESRMLLGKNGFKQQLADSLVEALPPAITPPPFVAKEKFTGHKALVNLLQTNGQVTQLLETEAKRLLPNIPERVVHVATESFMDEQRNRLLSPDLKTKSFLPRDKEGWTMHDTQKVASGYAKAVRESKMAAIVSPQP